MKIGNDVVVSIHYVIRDSEGRQIDATAPDRPWSYLHGTRACPPGLERALEHRTAGDRIAVELPPTETYGERVRDGVFRVSRSKLPPEQVPEIGMLLAISDQQGETELRVVGVDEEAITVDANHPLAGQTLRFEVAVVEVRPATAQEILTGEPNGAAEGGDASDLDLLPI